MNEVVRQKDQEFEPAAPQQHTDLMGVIQQIATDERFDVEKMQALIKMRADEEDRVRRIEREDRDEKAKRSWLREFAKVQSQIGPIVRSNDNNHTGSKFADLADIERIVTPILTEHGFSTTCVPVPSEIQGCIRMRLTSGHEEGHENVYEDDFPLDAAGSGGKVNKTPIQAKGSTQTYARRYLKASALDLAFMDDSDGNRGPAQIKTISADQYRALRDELEASGMDPVKFYKAYRHNDPENADLTQFPAASFDNAMKRLKNYAEAKAN